MPVSYFAVYKGIMPLFKKHLRPGDLGGMIYELLRANLEGSGDLSMEQLLDALGLNRKDLPEQTEGEVMIALMFAAALAIDRSAAVRVAQEIIAGMKSEFSDHLREQGANSLQLAEWDATVAETFLLYRTALEGYSGFEPPWKLGRQFFWNLVGNEDHVAMSIKIATLYLLAARDRTQNLLNSHGPNLILPHPTTQ